MSHSYTYSSLAQERHVTAKAGHVDVIQNLQGEIVAALLDKGDWNSAKTPRGPKTSPGTVIGFGPYA